MNYQNRTQNEVKSTLEAFDRCFVERKPNGELIATTAVCLSAGTQNEIVGQYRAADVFNSRERIINYVRQFRDFPYHVDGVHYDGVKDWAALRSNWTNVEMVGDDLIFG